MSYEAWRISFQSSDQAARAVYEQVKALSAQNAELVAQVEVLRKNLQIAHDCLTCADETGYVEDSGFIDLEAIASNITNAISATPAQCLRQIQAEAGRAGFVACAEEYGIARLNGSEQSINKHADLYALSIKYEFNEPMLRAAVNWVNSNKSKKPQFSIACGLIFNDNSDADEFDSYMAEIACDYHMHISPRDVVRLFVVADLYANRIKEGTL